MDYVKTGRHVAFKKNEGRMHIAKTLVASRDAINLRDRAEITISFRDATEASALLQEN